MTTLEKYETVRRAIVAVVPEIQGTHIFEIGHSKCKFCGEARIVRERIVHRELIDKDSGGSVREVTENAIDTTDFPCSKNHRRDIHLADLVIFVGTISRENIERITGMTKYQTLHAIGTLIELYNLRHDSLSWHAEHQPETVSWLYQLLCENV